MGCKNMYKYIKQFIVRIHFEKILRKVLFYYPNFFLYIHIYTRTALVEETKQIVFVSNNILYFTTRCFDGIWLNQYLE